MLRDEHRRGSRKEQFFASFDELVPTGGQPIDGADRLLNRGAKAAARNNDVGLFYEAYSSAELSRSGKLGQLQKVDVDLGGATGPNGERVTDALTDTHVIQMKSTTTQSELPLGPGGLKRKI